MTATEKGYYQSPTIHDDMVVFVCEDDLWTVSAQGGIARRLTANLGDVSAPSLSPDGQYLAFTGREEGESEVYCMPALGGAARRLTYLGVDSTVVGWTPDNKIVFVSNTAQYFFRITELYTISPEGGIPEKLPVGVAASIAFGPEGAMVIGRNTTDIARWKRYRGGLTGDIWIDSDGQGEWRRLIELDGNVARPLWVGERIYFVSDHEGIGNLYSCSPEGNDLQRHTHYNDYYVRNPATDGKSIVYHARADLYRFDVKTNQSYLIEIEFYSPRVQRNRKFVDAARYLEGYEIHPEGFALTITSRGKPFSFANWEGAVMQHGEADGVRYRLAVWLGDGKHIALISDAQGEEQLEIHAINGQNSQDGQNGQNEPTILADLDIGHPWGMLASPTQNQLALSNHRNELLLVDLDEKSTRVLDHSSYHHIQGFNWSPDGRWIAYGFSETAQTTVIRLCEAATGAVHTITQPVLRDINPAFDPEGKYLYFLSYRTFDPIYDSLQFDLTFPWGMRPYLITLQAELPSPFIPVPHAPGEKPPKESGDNGDNDDSETETEGDNDDDAKEESSISSSTEDKSQEEPPAIAASASDKNTLSETKTNPDSADGDSENTKENGKGAPPGIQIDLDGITQRIIAFPVSQGLYGQIRGIKGKVLYTTYPLQSALSQDSRSSATPAAKGTLRSFNFEDLSRETIATSVTSFDVSMDGKTLIYRSGNDLRVFKAGEKPGRNSSESSRKTGWIDLHRVKISVEPAQEWRQMYREAWRLQRDHFWSEDMTGLDWQTIYQRYLPLLDRVASRTEFTDLMWEMQGELGTSHAYVYGGDYRPEPDYDQGFLGADFYYDAETKRYEIARIIQGDIWTENASSPLLGLGFNINPGDQLLAINGRDLDQTQSPQTLLVNQAGQNVDLTILRQGEEKPAIITVKALSNEFKARYRDWINTNRQHVHQATDGRIGYIHIPDMGADGFAEFHRGYLAEIDREGLIVDVRNNRGGFVSPLLLEKLARRRLGYDVPRWGQPIPYPPESVLGPIVALCNQNSASDGDMFSHAFKLMGVGPLIGTRTWGGVIGIWPRTSLVDGGYTTQPEFSFWFNDVGWQVENYGVDPDIEVEIRPQDYAAEVDPQLERAIAEAMQRLESNPPTLPDFSQRPNRTLPKLPD